MNVFGDPFDIWAVFPYPFHGLALELLKSLRGSHRPRLRRVNMMKVSMTAFLFSS